MEHEEDLRKFAERAAELAELIRQNGDSPTGPGPGGLQRRVLVDLRERGPDPRLRAVEVALAQLATAIDDYLREREPG